jgi:secondary thiamine-phosphate synthase enzyme
MNSFTEYLWFNTTRPQEFINITQELVNLLSESKIQEGLMLVSAMHITAAVYINDDESGLIEDIQEWLQKLAPQGPDYKHHQTGEVNGHAHLRNLIIHHQVIIPVTKGLLDLGPWQQVFYAEFDGRRKKRVVVKILGE